MTTENAIPNPALLSDFARELLEQEEISREAALTGIAPGPITGISILDEEIGGFLARGLHVLIAPPGAGKTSLALQIAGTCGCPALYVTSEMPRVELLRRIIARTTNTFLGKLRGGRLSSDVLKAHISRAAAACPMLSIYDATTSPATVEDITERADALRARFDAISVLIVVDSVTDWAAGAMAGIDEGRVFTEYALAEAALNGLKSLTANLPGAVLAISHQNRAAQNTQGESKLYAAKGTGRYEYVSESLWYLEQNTSEIDEKHRTATTLSLLKNRHGAKGIDIDLKFEGRIQRFTE